MPTNVTASVAIRYDYVKGGNLLVTQNQLGSTLWDLEWTNGTSFYFDRQSNTCKVLTFPVGILAPDWLKGAQYLGRENVSSHLCDVWRKGPMNFITYWADVQSGQPVRFVFGMNGMQMDVITWEESKVLADEFWQAPNSCFSPETHMQLPPSSEAIHMNKLISSELDVSAN